MECKQREKTIFEEIMAENTPNFIKTINLWIQQPQAKKYEENYIKTDHNQIAQNQ